MSQKKIFLFSFALINLSIVFYFWLLGSHADLTGSVIGAYLALGRLSGLLLVFLILTQFFLAGRARLLETAFGLDRLTRLHHYIGMSLIIFLFAHPILLAAAYNGGFTGIWQRLLQMILKMDDILPAAISVILFLLVAVYSIIISKKKLNYQWWYFTHLTVYLAVLLAFGHQIKLGGDFSANKIFSFYWLALYAFVFFHILYFRFLVPFLLFNKHKFEVEKVVQENNFVWSIYISGKNLQDFNFHAGQFVMARFLDREKWWQSHPFSFSQKFDGKNLRISIKNSGDYTSTVKNIKPGAKVWLEGPYGIFTAQRCKSDKVLLIAGGIGITPIRAMLEDLAAKNKNIILLYGNKTLAETTFKSEIDLLATRFPLSAHYIMSADASWPGEKGHLNETLIKKLAPDLLERDVYLCGPPIMMKLIVNILTKIGLKKNKIFYENFSL